MRDPDEWMAKPYLATGARAIINAAAVARDSEHYGSMQGTLFADVGLPLRFASTLLWRLC